MKSDMLFVVAIVTCMGCSEPGPQILVTGRILSNDGVPLAGVQVNGLDDVDGRHWNTTYTGSAGTYEVLVPAIGSGKYSGDPIILRIGEISGWDAAVDLERVPVATYLAPDVRLWDRRITVNDDLTVTWRPLPAPAGFDVSYGVGGEHIRLIDTPQPSVQLDARMAQDLLTTSYVLDAAAERRPTSDSRLTRLYFPPTPIDVTLGAPIPFSRGKSCVQRGDPYDEWLSDVCYLTDGSVKFDIGFNEAIIDLGSNQAISAVSFTMAYTYWTYEGEPTNGTIEVLTSVDEQSWQPLGSLVLPSEQTQVAGAWGFGSGVIEPPAPNTGRYVRLLLVEGTRLAAGEVGVWIE